MNTRLGLMACSLGEKQCFLMFAFAFFTVIALSTGYTHALGDLKVKKVELVGDAKECSDLAWNKIRATGRSYNVERRGYDEKTGKVNIWIGEWLLLVPHDYVNLVGSGYPSDAPGISALLVGAMPDLTPRPKQKFIVIDGISQMTKIFLSCGIAMRTANLTRSDYLSNYFRQKNRAIVEYPLPEFGLIGYRDDGGFNALYFPIDSNIVNPRGGTLALYCDDLYPPKRWTGARPICSINFALRDGLFVHYEFPEHYLKHWKISYQNLIRLLNAFLVEK